MPADVWAFGTTLWEIFSFGALPDPTYDKDVSKLIWLKNVHIRIFLLFHSFLFLCLQSYFLGKRLSLPSGCPLDIYRLVLECWDPDMHRRKKPQAIMRDINQILYQGMYKHLICERLL